MNEFWIVTDRNGEIAYKGDTFAKCLKQVIDNTSESEFDYSFDHGLMVIKITKIRKRPFKILRDVNVVIHVEIKERSVRLMPAQKTILVTTFSKNGEIETEYGHYNAVNRKRAGWEMTSQKMYLCKMSEKTFYDNAEDRKEI